VNTPLLRQYIDSLPSLVAVLVQGQWKASQEVVSRSFLRGIERIYLTGCGDSHHAVIASALAFEQFAGIPCYPQTAMQLSRYSTSLFSEADEGSILVLAVSASGEVSRTVEALEQASHRGAKTVALTSNIESTLADAADLVMSTSIPELSPESPIASVPGSITVPGGVVVPGSRSYITSLISLYMVAIAAGLAQNHLSESDATNLVEELSDSSSDLQKTIDNSADLVEAAVDRWIDESDYIFCGAGPNYGTALFSAAKLLEACGDPALGQDLEEWAHLQYFARKASSPTLVISGGSLDQDRAKEIFIAASAIGRQTAIIAPAESPLAAMVDADQFHFQVAPIRESFSPLLTAIPGLLFASDRARVLEEPYFRDFGGGRSKEGGGGISRIRTSDRIQR